MSSNIAGLRVLVVGGAGFIGSHMVQELLAKGHDPKIYDNLSTGHLWAVPVERLVKGELADSSALEKLFLDNKFDCVMHFASSIQVGESMVAPIKYYTNNVSNTLNLLSMMERHSVKKMVFSSTAAVYGTPETVPIVESARLQPDNPYGNSKLMVEQILSDCDKAWGLKTAKLRYFNAAGAHPSCKIGEAHQPESHLIPIVLEVALGKRNSVTVNGCDYDTPDGTCIRDYIHVQDLVAAHVLALEALCRNEESQTYNIGNGKGYSVMEVIEVCRMVTGHPIPVELGSRRIGDPARLVASSDKLAEELGWEPKYSELHEIVKSAWDWHRFRETKLFPPQIGQ